jgi:6-phosphogluconate dehydrogenase (decarboxylating)
MATRVGYIGLGDMGGAMASNLAPKGFDTRVYDLDPKPMEALAAAGAKAAASCREVGEHAETTIASHSTVQPATIVRIQMFDAEKDLALEAGRKCGIALPADGLGSQDMARIYRVKNDRRH